MGVNSERPQLVDLEQQLRNLSHTAQALELIRDFAMRLGKTKDRQMVFGAEGALIRPPIEYLDVLEKNLIGETEDPFTLLQGDIVSTDTAYFMGERLSQGKFAIASSTCDLVAGRRQYASLLRLQPISANNPHAKQLISEMLKFKSTQRMYLPPLPNDRPDTIGNAIIFDGVIQVRLEDLLLSTRHASLSLVGWRIFGSLVRFIMVRAGDSEIAIRQGLQNQA